MSSSSKSSSEPAGEPVPLAFAITGGGVPTAEELAAITVALTPVAVVVGDGALDQRGHTMSPWNEAALLEGVGFRPFVSVDDLDRYHRSLA